MLCSQLCFRFLQKSLIIVDHTLLFDLRLLRCRLLLLAQRVRKRAAQRVALHLCLAGSVFFRTRKIPVDIEHLLRTLLGITEICGAVGAIPPVKLQHLTDFLRRVIIRDLIFLNARFDKRRILQTDFCVFPCRCSVFHLFNVGSCIFLRGRGLHFRQELPQVRRAALRVLIEYLLEKFVSLGPLAVFQRHIAAL